MKKILITGAMVMAAVLGVANMALWGVANAALLGAEPVAAEEVDLKKKCGDVTDAQLKAAWGCGNNEGVQTTAVRVINVAIGVLAVVAVAVIVMAGQRFLAAAGDPGKLKQAKNMVLYAVIGLVVAMLAWIIVNFVVTGIQG